MPVPVVNAFINFSTGPAFAPTLLLDSGILDTDVLGDSAAIIVDVSDVVSVRILVVNVATNWNIVVVIAITIGGGIATVAIATATTTTLSLIHI